MQIRKLEDNYSKDYVKNIAGEIKVSESIIDNALVPEIYIDATKKQIETSKLQLFRNLYWADEYSQAKAAFMNTYTKLRTMVDWLRYAKFLCLLMRKDPTKSLKTHVLI